MPETPDDSKTPESPRSWTRRRALRLMGAGSLAGAGYVLLQNTLDDEGTRVSQRGGASASHEVHTGHPRESTTTTEPTTTPPGELARWSDPATWGGRVPGPSDTAVVERPVLLDVDAETGGVRITPEGELVFDPEASRRLRTTGNVAVDGALRMKPANAGVVHRITFADIDESAIVGGHTHMPIPTDVGLWAIGSGVLDVAGTAKTAWTRAAGALRAGARRIEVADATGWRRGDEIVVTPTEAATVEDYTQHHDRVRIAAVDGNTVTLDRPLRYPHPEVTVRDGVTYRAEVLNLTRNTVIEGTRRGRAHIMILSSQPQQLSHLELPHLGPQTANPDDADAPMGVTGRYGVHFHMVGDGSRGSVVEGVVVRDGGNHAFVAHLSNGVTFRDCVSHDTVEDAYWWDFAPDDDQDSVPSHDITYERCIAHLVRHGSDKYGLTGFMLGSGHGNVARHCVAVAVMGYTESSSGFEWTSASLDTRTTWTFEDNLAHNVANSGVYYWQSEIPKSYVERFTSYQNGHGLFAGSYSNMVSYRDCTIYACRESGLTINAVPDAPRRRGETITFERLYVDQAGLTDYAVDITEHVVDSELETHLTECTFKGGSSAQVAIPEGSDLHQLYLFRDCTFDGNAFWLSDDVPPHTALRVEDDRHGSIVLRRADQDGEVNRDWNAAVSRA